MIRAMHSGMVLYGVICNGISPGICPGICQLAKLGKCNIFKFISLPKSQDIHLLLASSMTELVYLWLGQCIVGWYFIGVICNGISRGKCPGISEQS